MCVFNCLQPILPMHAGISVGIATMTNWGSAYIFTQAFPPKPAENRRPHFVQLRVHAYPHELIAYTRCALGNGNLLNLGTGKGRGVPLHGCATRRIYIALPHTMVLCRTRGSVWQSLLIKNRDMVLGLVAGASTLRLTLSRPTPG